MWLQKFEIIWKFSRFTGWFDWLNIVTLLFLVTFYVLLHEPFNCTERHPLPTLSIFWMSNFVFQNTLFLRKLTKFVTNFWILNFSRGWDFVITWFFLFINKLLFVRISEKSATNCQNMADIFKCKIINFLREWYFLNVQFY